MSCFRRFVASGAAEEGIEVYSWYDASDEEMEGFYHSVLDAHPQILIDDGADLVKLLHTTRTEVADGVWGGAEETTTGILRLKALEKAVKLYQEEPEYLCYLALAKFKAASGDAALLSQANELIQKAIRLNANLDKAHLFHGYMLKEAGRLREAGKRFERAIQCNPDCTEALRELRLVNMRTTSEKGPSVLGKMFKK